MVTGGSQEGCCPAWLAGQMETSSSLSGEEELEQGGALSLPSTYSSSLQNPPGMSQENQEVKRMRAMMRPNHTIKKTSNDQVQKYAPRHSVKLPLPSLMDMQPFPGTVLPDLDFYCF